jgi:hypothetical protein
MSEEEKPKLGWGGRREGSGRRRGSVDARPREIREAMLLGAATSDLGRDEEHPEGDLVVFFRTLCNKELPLFVGLLNRLIPKQINQQTESTIGLNVVFETVDQVAAELERSGMSHQQVKQIQAMLPVPIVDDEEKHDDVEMFDRDRDHG